MEEAFSCSEIKWTGLDVGGELCLSVTTYGGLLDLGQRDKINYIAGMLRTSDNVSKAPGHRTQQVMGFQLTSISPFPFDIIILRKGP